MVPFFGGDDGYEKRKEHDLTKREYCTINKINLLYYGKTGGNDIIKNKEEILTKMEDMPL